MSIMNLSEQEFIELATNPEKYHEKRRAIEAHEYLRQQAEAEQEANDLTRESNKLTKEEIKINKKSIKISTAALVVSIITAGVSLISLIFTIINFFRN